MVKKKQEEAMEEGSEEVEESKEETADEVEESEEASEEESKETSESSSSSGSTSADGRELFNIKCSECGKNAQVPFKPSGDRPVYCRDCFMKRRKPRFGGSGGGFGRGGGGFRRRF